MNLFRSEEHARKWSQFDPAYEMNLKPYLIGQIDSALRSTRPAPEPTIFPGVRKISAPLLRISRQGKKSKFLSTQKRQKKTYTFSCLTLCFRPIATSAG